MASVCRLKPSSTSCVLVRSRLTSCCASVIASAVVRPTSAGGEERDRGQLGERARRRRRRRGEGAGRTGYPLGLLDLLLLLGVDVGLLLHGLVLLERRPGAVKVVVRLAARLVLARLLVALDPRRVAHVLVVLVRLAAGRRLVVARRLVGAAEEALEPAWQALERRLVEPHGRLAALGARREDLALLERLEQAVGLVVLVKLDGRGRGPSALGRRRLDRLGLGRHLVLVVGRVLVARGLRRRVKVALGLLRLGVRVGVAAGPDALELAALLERALEALLLDLVLVVALELGLLERLVEQVEALLEAARLALVVRDVLVIVVVVGAVGDDLHRHLALVLDLVRARDVLAVHVVVVVAQLGLAVAVEAAAAHAAALLAALDLAEVEHLHAHAVLLLETNVHRRAHVELHALDLARLLLVDAAALAALFEGLVAGEAFELQERTRVSLRGERARSAEEEEERKGRTSWVSCSSSSSGSMSTFSTASSFWSTLTSRPSCFRGRESVAALGRRRRASRKWTHVLPDREAVLEEHLEVLLAEDLEVVEARLDLAGRERVLEEPARGGAVRGSAPRSREVREGERERERDALLVLVVLEAHAGDHAEDTDRVLVADPLHDPALLVQGHVAVVVALALLAVLLGRKDVERRGRHDVLGRDGAVVELGERVGRRLLALLRAGHLVARGVDLGEALARAVLLVGAVDLGEDVLGVEHARVDLGRREEALAGDEDLGRHVTRRRRLGRLDFGEELVEDPEERVVVLGAEDLGAEGAAGAQELDGELERREDELDLGEGVLDPGGSDVGRTVVEDAAGGGDESVSGRGRKEGSQSEGKGDAHVGLPVLHLGAESTPARLGRDVLDERDAARDGLDGDEVDADDDRVLLRHLLGGDLKPSSGRGAQVDDALGAGEEVVLAVELDELEGGTGTVALLPGGRRGGVSSARRRGTARCGGTTHLASMYLRARTTRTGQQGRELHRIVWVRRTICRDGLREGRGVSDRVARSSERDHAPLPVFFWSLPCVVRARLGERKVAGDGAGGGRSDAPS